MKLVFILVLTAFTVCLSKELHRHRHEKKFPQGSETIQKDAYIGPKLGVEHNRLSPEYGINFRYIGEVRHGLDRVTVVTSIPIPTYSGIRKKPLQFNCTIDLNRKEAKTVGSYQYRVHEYCAKVMPYVRYMQNQEKSLVHGLRQLLIHDLYSALPELNPDYKIQGDEPVDSQPLSSKDKHATRTDHPGCRKFDFMD